MTSGRAAHQLPGDSGGRPPGPPEFPPRYPPPHRALTQAAGPASRPARAPGPAPARNPRAVPAGSTGRSPGHEARGRLAGKRPRPPPIWMPATTRATGPGLAGPALEVVHWSHQGCVLALVFGCGVPWTVTVTVGTGFGLGGSTESPGFLRGPATTTPTTPSEVKFTNGRTSAVLVSDPAVPCTWVTVPIGTPGT